MCEIMYTIIFCKKFKFVLSKTYKWQSKVKIIFFLNHATRFGFICEKETLTFFWIFIKSYSKYYVPTHAQDEYINIFVLYQKEYKYTHTTNKFHKI